TTGRRNTYASGDRLPAIPREDLSGGAANARYDVFGPIWLTATWPLRFRPSGSDLIFTDEAGGWFASSEAFLDRYVTGKLTAEDHTFLLRGGHAFERELDLYYSSFLQRWTARHATPAEGISYLILVPTLRCNLACDYCQVSRAAEGAKGFD